MLWRITCISLGIDTGARNCTCVNCKSESISRFKGSVIYVTWVLLIHWSLGVARVVYMGISAGMTPN